MKRSSTIIVISGIVIVAAMVSAIVVSTHLRLSATTEGNEKGSSTLQQSAKEILTGRPLPSVEENNNHTNGQQQSESNLSFDHLTGEGSPWQGSPSAEITLVEFGDFQCEFCARFAKDTESQIYQNYIQTGKVNMVFKHMAHYGSTSDLAASASQCANDQGKFWDYYHVLYTNQDSFMLAQDTQAALKNLASKVDGLDSQKFNACFDGGTYKDIAKKDAQVATSLGLDNTPSFLIVKSKDGSLQQKLVGAYPFGTFKAVLDKAILQSGSGGSS
jgi:protein-disulfide isomerase